MKADEQWKVFPLEFSRNSAWVLKENHTPGLQDSTLPFFPPQLCSNGLEIKQSADAMRILNLYIIQSDSDWRLRTK